MADWGLDARDRELLFGDGAAREGDAVVHFEHGLARYGGRQTIEVEGAAQELTVLVYRHGGKLMLPAEEGRDFWAYGAPADDVTLDRLRAGDWAARRDEMIAELHEAADRLVEEDRKRRSQDATPLHPDADRMAAFADGFGHAPTADQARAIDAVLEDLAGEVPMDRLVIGDVGFGKTEVALRAVAAAVLDGRQAVMAAPTAVLARQHADTLRARLEPFGVGVAEISRLAGAAEREAALADLASGAAGVAVGTQALLSDDVAFRDLALVVIDEEQKFGREQKEGLRALARGAHLLRMTATPIPRTLAAAEVGLVDVSVVATAPAARQPVATRTARPSDKALCAAVGAEVARGGQAYVVCPRIDDLPDVVRMLDGCDVTHAVAHGQLPEDEMEERMGAFMRGEVDVLVSTAIVESGLDNPRANTMVVFHPERFGLTQLHQLRGRVGRGGEAAEMLLLTGVDLRDPDPEDEAAARLSTFAAEAGVGCGFALARRDRDLRGFGELDGDEQSGQVSRLGLGLYRHILRERVLGAPEERRAA